MNKFSPVPEIKSNKEKKHFKNFISKHFSEKADFWNLVYDKNHEPLNLMNEDFRQRKETVFHFFDKHFNDKGKVLDLGCGTGVYLKEIMGKGHNCIGIDISFEMVSSAEDKLSDHDKLRALVMQGDIEKLPFADGSMDCIICAGTLEFLPDLKSAIAEIKRVLSKNGLLIVTFPNALKMKNIFDPMFYYSHLKRKKLAAGSIKEISGNQFSGKKFLLFQILKRLKNSGFKLIEYRGIGFGPIQFLRKDLFSKQNSYKIYQKIQSMADKKMFRSLYNISNRWVICLQKTS